MVLGLIGIFKPPRKDQYQFAAGTLPILHDPLSGIE
jgi:hypothetical protein